MPEKTKIIFSFDTEDYVNEIAADSILRSARILREGGAKGCFRVAEALVKRGRRGVTDEPKDRRSDRLRLQTRATRLPAHTERTVL